MFLKAKDIEVEGYDFSEPERECLLCGSRGGYDSLDRHHIFGGSYRAMSEKYRLTAYLCHYKCHLYGELAVHNNPETMQQLHRYGQRLFYRKGGTKEQFIKIFNHNFLEV